jgi:hypothetical protein
MRTVPEVHLPGRTRIKRDFDLIRTCSRVPKDDQLVFLLTLIRSTFHIKISHRDERYPDDRSVNRCRWLRLIA